jgi:hypothetical protein
MLKDKPENVEVVKKRMDEISKTYDESKRTLEGRTV